MPRIPMNGGDEHDILGTKRGRRFWFCKEWLRRNSNRVKTWYRRRERHTAKLELKRQINDPRQ